MGHVLSKGSTVLTVGPGIAKTIQAQKGERAHTFFVEGMKVAGGYVGGAIAGSLVMGSSIPSGGTSLVLSSAAIVGGSAAGSYAFENLAEQIESVYDYVQEKTWR